MNDKVVTLPMAKRLKEAGWVKFVNFQWWYDEQKKKYVLSYFKPGETLLMEADYFAPDLLDITREIRETRSLGRRTI